MLENWHVNEAEPEKALDVLVFISTLKENENDSPRENMSPLVEVLLFISQTKTYSVFIIF